MSQARDIAESFYRLHPGMTAQDINFIAGQALPLFCKPQGHVLDINRTKDKYDLRIDLSGRLERMNSTERHPEYILSDDEFRAVARRHRCGGGKQFELQKEYAQLTSRTLDPSKMRTIKFLHIRFHDKFSSRMGMGPNLVTESGYIIHCGRTAEWALWLYQSDGDLCEISKIFCPVPRGLFNGSRF